MSTDPSRSEPDRSPAPTAIAPTGTAMSSAAVAAQKVSASSPAAATQLKDLPLDELERIARDYGLNPRRFDTKASLVSGILERRTVIGSLDREAMLELARWGRRSVPSGAGRERLAAEIVRVRSMKFAGLSHRALLTLAALRNVSVTPDDPTPQIVARLKEQEGLFAKLGRKRRHLVGKWVSRMIGEPDAAEQAAARAGDRHAAPASTTASPSSPRADPHPRADRALQDEIEETGLIAGITSRMRRTADQYLNQKLDEIEARIDRKLDEIDRRLAEWRDKEVANRLRILKVSLWATVAVGTATLIISYIRVYMPWMFGG